MSVLASAPALPLHRAGPYVAAAYIVFVVLLLVYLGIMALRTSRTQRDLALLRRELETQREQPAPDDEAAREQEPVL